MHVNNKTLVTAVIPAIAYITTQQMLFFLACDSSQNDLAFLYFLLNANKCNILVVLKCKSHSY